MLKNKQAEVVPFIPATVNLPEITFRAIFLGIILAVILAASSTFVGLKIARTVAASIPAALISMLVLRRFKTANILENNMVQTIASAGEAVAAAVIFTLPALIIMGYWKSFNYLQTTLITIIGGVLGVLFSVPLRRSMIIEENLPYPEGIATGEVLKAGEAHNKSTKVLLTSGILSAIIAFFQTGLKIAGEQIQYWTKVGSTAFGGSIMLSPILMAAGYIVGMNGLISFVAGGVLTWGLFIPIFVAKYGLPEAKDLVSALLILQKSHFRYVGVGVLAVGGLWSIITLMKQIKYAIKSSFIAMKLQRNKFNHTLRTERDLPFKYVLLGIIVIAIPTFCLFFSLFDNSLFSMNSTVLWSTVLFATVFSLLIGFIAAAIAAYIVGVVGTTSLPISGITIAAIIAFASILLIILKTQVNLNTSVALEAAAIVIIFAMVICVSASLSGDNMQDLKAGQLVGATPWKQQLMLAIGAIASACVIPFILQTTFEAYGIADILPRAGMDPEQALPAPQAMLMATIAKGFFVGQLPWHMIAFGALLAVIAICIDEFLKVTKSNFKFPVLLFALGIYLPLGYVTAFLVGGIINSLAKRKTKKQIGNKTNHETNYGVLCAAGIIAGEAILGAILTIPFAYYQSTDLFAIKVSALTSCEHVIGIVLYLSLSVYLYKQAIK
jgi:putative OPT family oligopeptide transporter